MTANRVFPNSGTGAAYVAGVKEEGDALWNYACVPLTVTGGTADAVQAACTVPITTLVDGMGFLFRPTGAPTGPFTIDIDAVGVKDVVDRHGNPITKGLMNIGGDYELRWRSATGKLVAVGVEAGRVGRQDWYIRADMMVARTTTPPAAGSVETTTNKVMLKSFDFDPATPEYVQFSFLAPKRWDEGTMKAKFVWSHAATATNFGVVWAIQGLSLSDDDAGDTAFGTAVTVTDTGGTTNDIYVTAETAAFTLGNTPNEGDLVVFQVYRDAANGSDTMTIDARLMGVMLYWTSNAASEA